MEKAVLKVEGMSCEHCVRAVTEAIGGVAGASDVSVDLDAGTASFHYDSAATLETVKGAIIEEGYTLA